MPEGFYNASTLAKGGRIDRDAVPDGNNTITHIWVPNTIAKIDTWGAKGSDPFDTVH